MKKWMVLMLLAGSFSAEAMMGREPQDPQREPQDVQNEAQEEEEEKENWAQQQNNNLNQEQIAALLQRVRDLENSLNEMKLA